MSATTPPGERTAQADPIAHRADGAAGVGIQQPEASIRPGRFRAEGVDGPERDEHADRNDEDDPGYQSEPAPSGSMSSDRKVASGLGSAGFEAHGLGEGDELVRRPWWFR